MAQPRKPNRPISPAGKNSRSEKKTRMTPRAVVGLVSTVAIAVTCWYFLTGEEIRLSEKGYELSKALYAACNLEDTKRLEAFVKAMDQHSPSPEEQSKLRPIVELAQSGRWQDAADRARSLLQSQDKH
jgi:hypothetical protein